MLTASAVLFVLALSIGMAMATMIFLGRPIPVRLPVVHASLVLPALGLLVYSAFLSSTWLWASVSLFGLAVIGGVMLVGQHLSQGAQSRGLAVIHGTVALIGLVIVMTRL